MFRFVLRHETRAEHGALDQHPAFAALLDGTMSLDGYRNLMLAFHGFYLCVDGPLQQACVHHALDRFGFLYEPRTAILANDLAALGAVVPLSTVPSLPVHKLDVDSIESLGGALYVFEGSLLGASMMCASTDALLERSGSGGNAYWRWCRETGSKRWAMTCQLIENLATSDPAKARMVEGAQTAFRSFAQWLDHRHDAFLPAGRKPC